MTPHPRVDDPGKPPLRIGVSAMIPEVPPVLTKLLEQPPQPQRSFAWEPAGWHHQMHDLPDVRQMLDALPERVDRGIVRTVVARELDRQRVLPAFVSAMVWGYGDKGYGPTRVRRVLTGVKTGARDAPVRDDVAGVLRTAAEVVRREGPVEGFRYMNNAGRIKHLAASFFTKWLYFASALSDPDDVGAAPILDMRVRNWLQDHTGVDLDLRQTRDYETYLMILNGWGALYGRTSVQVEQAIFSCSTRNA